MDLSEAEQAAFIAGFRAGFWQGASDSMTIGLDVLKKSAEEQVQTKEPKEGQIPTYASA